MKNEAKEVVVHLSPISFLTGSTFSLVLLLLLLFLQKLFLVLGQISISQCCRKCAQVNLRASYSPIHPRSFVAAFPGKCGGTFRCDELLKLEQAVL